MSFTCFSTKLFIVNKRKEKEKKKKLESSSWAHQADDGDSTNPLSV